MSYFYIICRNTLQPDVTESLQVVLYGVVTFGHFRHLQGQMTLSLFIFRALNDFFIFLRESVFSPCLNKIPKIFNDKVDLWSPF